MESVLLEVEVMTKLMAQGTQERAVGRSAFLDGSSPPDADHGRFCIVIAK